MNNPSGSDLSQGPALSQGAVRSHAFRVGGATAFIGLFLLGAAMGTVLGDQPGVTLFCWVIGFAALGAQGLRWRTRALSRHSDNIPVPFVDPRRWRLKSRPY